MENLVQLVKDVVTRLNKDNESLIAKQIDAAYIEATKNNCKVMICGEFKRGKSSLINSYLETEVCKVDEDIATANVSMIKYGDEAKIIRSYKGQEGELLQQEISINEIEKYAAGDGAHVDNTVLLEISLPNEKLKDGLIIVDSPGVGGMNPVHDYWTSYFIDQVDIVLFVVSAERPMESSEVNFYKEKILSKAKKCAFVLNMIDMPNVNIKQSIEDIKNKIGQDVEILPYSALDKKNYLILKNKDKEEATKYLTSSNAAGLDNLLSKTTSEYKKEILSQCFDLMYDSLENVKKTWILKGMELKEFDLSSYEELKRIYNELVPKMNELSNPQSKFRIDLEKNTKEILLKIQVVFNDNKKILMTYAEESAKKGTDVETIGKELQNKLTELQDELTELLRQLENTIAESIHTEISSQIDTYVNEVETNDTTKGKIQKYVTPILVGGGAKGIVGMALGSALGSAWLGPISIGVGIFVAWKLYRDANITNNVNIVKSALQESLQTLSNHVNLQKEKIIASVPELIFEQKKKIEVRMKEINNAITEIQSEKADKEKQLKGIVLNEINPISELQAMIKKQRNTINI